MQNFNKYCSYIFLLSVVILSGCASVGASGTAGNVTGTWKFKDPNYGPQMLTFRRDGMYELDYDGNGVKDIWGTYRISQNWLIMNDIGGDFIFDCGQQGAYYYKVTGKELTFILMADQCPSRHEAMSVQWVRASKPNENQATAPEIKI